MKNKTLFFVILLLFSINDCHADVYIYDTYQNYLNNSGEKIDNYKSFDSARNLMFTEKEGQKGKIKLQDKWGFKVNKVLYRITKDNKIALVCNTGKVIYYENDYARNTNLIYRPSIYTPKPDKYPVDNNSYVYNKSDLIYISLTLESPMIAVPGKFSSISSKVYEQFIKENPQHTELFKCLEKYMELKVYSECYETARECIKHYEGGPLNMPLY